MSIHAARPVAVPFAARVLGARLAPESGVNREPGRPVWVIGVDHPGPDRSPG